MVYLCEKPSEVQVKNGIGVEIEKNTPFETEGTDRKSRQEGSISKKKNQEAQKEPSW